MGNVGYYALVLIQGQGLDESIRDRTGEGEGLHDPDATVTAGRAPALTLTGRTQGSCSGTSDRRSRAAHGNLARRDKLCRYTR